MPYAPLLALLASGSSCFPGPQLLQRRLLTRSPAVEADGHLVRQGAASKGSLLPVAVQIGGTVRTRDRPAVTLCDQQQHYRRVSLPIRDNLPDRPGFRRLRTEPPAGAGVHAPHCGVMPM